MSRERVLSRVRETLVRRERVPHPGPFGEWRPTDQPERVAGFAAMFEAAGGEVASARDSTEAAAWIARFASSFASMTLGETLPPGLAPSLPEAPSDRAALALSRARCAIAETGSLVMDSRDGRRTQLLAPSHVVLVDEASVFATLHQALMSIRDDLPSAIGLHSGPSKSADIGQVMVRGVHGPGRVVALLIAHWDHP